jgi:signal transduction histidine kinase
LKGEIELSFELEDAQGESSERHVVFKIRDTGIGIPAEHIPHLFERFYRVKENRGRSHGTPRVALALAIAATTAAITCL